MKRLLALSLLSFAACAVDETEQTSQQLASGRDRYVVVFKAKTLPADAAARVQRAGGRVAQSLREVGVLTASGDAAFATKMKRDSAVAAVGLEQVYGAPEITVGDTLDEAALPEAGVTTADNLYGYQWDMRRMGAPAVWARMPLPTGGRKANVAVLDTGVMESHPDLVGQVCATKATTYCNTPGGPANTASYPIYASLIDFDAHPDWSPEDGCTPVPASYQSHGTHVAGTIAAKFGGGRVVGVAPDACVAAYKVFDRYRYTDPVDGLIDDVGAFDGPLFAAIIDAANNDIDVISMSLGSTMRHAGRDGNASWQAWNRVLGYANRAGTIVVASAGNSALDSNGTIAHVPGDISTAINTSASGWSELVVSGGMFQPAPGSTDVLAFYSNYGSAVDVTAPGGDCGPQYPNACESQYLILSTYIFESGINIGRPGYAFFAGTSMATPHVSAVAAMVRALHPDWTPGQVRSFLKDTAQDLGDRQSFGQGMVDADAATR